MPRFRCLLIVSLFAGVASASSWSVSMSLAAGQTPESAQILVKLPPGAARAVITLGDYVTASTGLERQYITPPLDPAKKYFYEVTATWSSDGKEFKLKEKAAVTAGKLTTVDFTKAVVNANKDGAGWPQWLGPQRDGSTTETVLPWKGELNKLWHHPVGDGHSSPIVANGLVYIHYVRGDKEIEVIDALNAESGKLQWSFEYPRPLFKNIFGRGPRSTPAVAGGKLYAFGASGILTCVDANTGMKLWQIDTRKQFKSPELKFGIATSPLVAGDKVLVNVGAKGASVVAFNKDNGDVIWKCLDDGASYSSPILYGSGPDHQVVFLTQKGLVGLSLDKGALQWRFPFEDKFAESSTTPVRIGDNLLASSITLGTVLVNPDKSADKPQQVWINPDLTCYFSTPIAVGKDTIYLVTGALSLSPSSTLHCISTQAGKPLWKKENVGKYHACLLRTGNSKLLMVEEAGNLVLIDPDPKQYRELSRSKICGKTWAHPALANGKLYIRDEKQLVCVQLAQ